MILHFTKVFLQVFEYKLHYLTMRRPIPNINFATHLSYFNEIMTSIFGLYLSLEDFCSPVPKCIKDTAVTTVAVISTGARGPPTDRKNRFHTQTENVTILEPQNTIRYDSKRKKNTQHS